MTGLTSTPSDGAAELIAPHRPIPEAIAGSRRTAARFTPRRDLLEQLHPFRAQTIIEQHEASGVAARPRQTIDKAGAGWIGDTHEHDRHGACRLKQRIQGWRAHSQDDVGRKRDQFRRVFASLVGISRGPAIVNFHVSAVGPTQLLQRLQERSDVGLRAWIVRVAAALKHADAPHLFRVLRVRG
ncbi:MAG: hypothetical protein WCF53_15275 [Pseudolabrys sp.]